MTSFAIIRKYLILIKLVTLMVFVVVFTPDAGALTVTFNVLDVPQLRQAISDASNWPTDDEIIIKLKAGIYTLAGAAGEDLNAAGDLDIAPVGALTMLTLERDENGGSVIIDGDGVDRVFEIFPRSSGDLTVSFNNIVIQNGSIDGYGGGIFINPGGGSANIIVNMTNVKVSGNTVVESGGGIAIGSNVTLIFIGGEISSNTTEFNGGGLYCFGGTAILQNTLISNNTAMPPIAGIGGGAVFNAGGDVHIDSACTINGNETFASGLYGGALANTGFGTMIVDTPISNNFGTTGGIFNQDGMLSIALNSLKPVMPGDVIIMSGSVTIDYTGVLMVYGSVYHFGGDFIYTGDLRFWRPTPSIPLLLLDN